MFPSPRLQDMVLIFVCQAGFRLVGKRTLYCDGQRWSDSPPVCQQQQPLTTASALLDSSTAATSTDNGLTVYSPALSSLSLTGGSRVPSLTTGPPLTRELSRAPVLTTPVLTTEVVVDDVSTSASRYLPASFSVPASLDTISVRLSTSGAPATTPIVTRRQRNTGIPMTSAETLPRLTGGFTWRLVPTWPLLTPSVIGNFTFSESQRSVSVTTLSAGFRSTAVTSAVQSRRITLPATDISSIQESSGLPVQSETTPDVTTDTLLANATDQVRIFESSEDKHGGRTLIWYAAVTGSCAVALVVVVAAACVLVVRRRAPAFRTYQLMNGEDEMQCTAAAAVAGSGRSLFYATKYTELTDSYRNDHQQNSAV